MVVVVVRMGVRNPVMCVLMAVRCSRRRRHGMGVIVVPVVVGVFVCMGHCIMSMRVRMLRHRSLRM